MTKDKKEYLFVQDEQEAVIDVYPDTMSGRGKARKPQLPKDDWFEKIIQEMEDNAKTMEKNIKFVQAKARDPT